MNIYRETIQTFIGRELTFRVWRAVEQRDGIIAKHDDDVGFVISDMHKQWQLQATKDLMRLAEAVLEMERVNAVQVSDKHNNGCVVYKDWP